MSSIFEPIFDGSVLTRSVIETLKKWMPTYLEEIEHQRNIPTGKIPQPRRYTERNEFSTFSDDQIPMVVVISPGLADPPRADGEGRYSGTFALGIGVIASANTEENSEMMAKIYGAAVRAIMLQKQGLDEAWEYGGTEFEDETYDDVPDPEQERTMRAARLVFRVNVENLTTRFAGPAYPVEPDPAQVGAEWPTVETADVTVKAKEG